MKNHIKKLLLGHSFLNQIFHLPRFTNHTFSRMINKLFINLPFLKLRFLIIFEESSKMLMMVFTEDSHFIGSERRILSVNRGQHGSINEVEKDLICK